MKFCPNCGAQLPDDAQFCGSCGAQLAPAQTPPPPQPQAPMGYAQPQPQYAAPAPNYAQEADGTVRLCQDGKYRWVYELNMFKSTAILGTLLKIFGGLIIGIWLLIGITSGFDDFGETSKYMLIALVCTVVLILVAYGIVALINGGKYCVLFTMDDTGLMHTQLPKQFKKAQVAGWIATLAGIAAGVPGAAGAGILAATRNSLISNFSKVRTIKADPAHNIIKVNSPLSKNQVYVDDAQFQFVYDFIRSHCPNAK